MTEIPKSPQQKDSHLPDITKKQQQSKQLSDQSSQNEQQEENNHLPLTHTKKKRRHKKKVRKHSPQYYEELKVKKLNRKLEQRWDSHFINDHIPDLFQRKKMNGRTMSKMASDKRAITALQHKMPVKTTTTAIKKQTMPLPRIQKSNKRSKSFNIHLVQQKRQQPPAQSKPSKPQQPTQKQKQKPIINKKHEFFDEYKKKINETFEQVKFLNCHKQLLELFLELIQKKSIREMIDKELGNVRKKQALISKVMTAITNREAFLDKVRNLAGKKDANEKDLAENVDHYRTSTLAVVQDILKWKQNWQEVYRQVFKKQKPLDLVYKTQNYLLTIASSTDEILALSHNKSKEQTKPENTSPQKKQLEVKSPQKKQPSSKNIEKQKTTQKQPKVDTITPQQKTSPQKPQQTVQKSPQKQPQKKLKSQTNISPEKNSQPQQKPQPQKKPVTQHKLQPHDQVQKPKIPLQLKPTHPLTSDPFLISLYGIKQQDNNIVLKIRACQLLLLQEQYNFLKKDH